MTTADELRQIAIDLEKAANALDYIAGSESEEDKARTLADDEVLHRVAKKFRDAAQAVDDQVENPDR